MEKQKQQPDSDATSKETLKDLEETEKVSGKNTSTDSVKSPDGAFDEQEELEKADPT